MTSFSIYFYKRFADQKLQIQVLLFYLFLYFLSCKNGETRSSERIRRKQKTFRMPSRQDVFQNIPSLKSPVKDMAAFKPLKLVNNFTKE